MEVCAVKVHLLSYVICIITVYRSPSGNFQHFLLNLEKILSRIYTNTIEIIICWDFNINYLNDSTYKSLDSLLASRGLSSTVLFPTRFFNNSQSAIDNIFINTLKFKKKFCIPSYKWSVRTQCLKSVNT